MRRRCSLTVSILGVIIMTSIFILVFSIYVVGLKINLQDYSKIKDKVEEVGIDYHYSKTKGRDSKCFYLKLKSMSYKVGYNDHSFFFHNYDDLIENIQKGDTVTVYYNLSNTFTLDQNIDDNVVQIEKRGQVLLGKNETENYNLGMSILLLVIIISFLYYGIKQIFKISKYHKKRKRK